MKKAFVIVSVSDRIKELNALMDNIIELGFIDQYDVCLYFQDPHNVQHLIKNRKRYATLIVDKEKRGCHGARVLLLQAIKYDIYCNLDDDMVLTPHTRYEKAIDKALEKSTGFVCTNWARTKKLYEAKIPKMQEKFIKQTMVYQGGGMLYRDEIANLMRALPPIPQTFDHAWCLTSYINGYTNYRYLGSLAIHMICSSGGMQTYMKEIPTSLMFREYINFTFSNRGSGVLIPMDESLTQLAKDEHARNKK